MWKLFDRVIVMSEGEILFNIRTADFQQILQAASVTIPENVNPADFLIELLQNKNHDLQVLMEQSTILQDSINFPDTDLITIVEEIVVGGEPVDLT